MSEPSKLLIYRIDDIDVDTRRGCILRDGLEVPLKPKAFRVLVHLLKERHRLVSKEELMDLFWTETAVTDDALSQCIARLRRALADDPRNPIYLKTVPRMGYRFVGPVKEIPAAPVPPAIPEPTAESSVHSAVRPVIRAGPPGPTLHDWDEAPTTGLQPAIGQMRAHQGIWQRLPIRRISWILGGILLAGSLAAAALWTATLRHPARAGQAKRLLAILPFENRSGQRDLDWLREGLPEMLATTVSRSKSIDLVSREQVYARPAKGENGGIKTDLEWARTTHAQAVMTGSFSKLGDSMRVDVRIYDTNNGSILATGDLTVDGQERLLTEVDFLAGRLAGRIAPQTSDQDHRVLGSLMTDNLEAYRYYSLGLDKADAMLSSEAIALFEKALALDPRFVMAQARIGYAYLLAPGGESSLEKARPYLEKAFKVAGRLTDRDRRHIIAWYAIANQDYQTAMQRYTELLNEYPNDPEAQFRLATLLRGEGRHGEALDFLHRATAINPEDPKNYNSLSAVFSEMGRHADAIAMAERYRSLAPRDPNAYDSLGLSYYMAGQYDRALEAYGKALALKPDFDVARFHRALVYAAMGRVKEAVRESLQEDEHGVAHVTNGRGWTQAIYILWRSGRTEQAKELAARSVGDCDPRLLIALRKPAATQPSAFKIGSVGRAARFGQRTGYFFLAEYAKLQGRTPERLENLRQLLRAKPGWGELEVFEDALGDAYLELGRVDEAIAEYERALRLFPGLARAQYHLAQAYRRKGQNEAAKERFRAFLSIWKKADPDLPELARASGSVDLAQESTGSL